eukprot:scaffold73585_cov19-Tisochrysis_lutea.AAC.1
MGSIFGFSAAPEPAFNVIQKFAEYEVRRYGPQLRAQRKELWAHSHCLCPPAGGNARSDGQHKRQRLQGLGRGFRHSLVASGVGYIFGGNTKQGHESEAEKIAMTVGTHLQIGQSSYFASQAPVAMNTTSEKIQMTAPVAIQQPEGQQPEQQKTVMLAAARDNVPLSTDPKDVELWGYNPPD